MSEKKLVYKPFKDGIELSTLGLGNMRLPSKDLTDRDAPINYEEAFKIIKRAYNAGINYYDTAYVYNAGDSEKCVGEAMKEFDRSTFYIATKFNLMANPDYKAVFEEQLKRLQTDYIDFYLLHAVMDKNMDGYIDCGCIEYFKELKAQGKIKYLGFSSHASAKGLEKFVELEDWDFVQIQMNYFDWIFDEAKDVYEVLAKRNIPIIIMEPVRGGVLANLSEGACAKLKAVHPDWSIASWAFRFLKKFPAIQVVLSGMSTLDQLEDNLKNYEDYTPLTEEEEAVLFEACKMYKEEISVPCTACRYCTGDCPVEINIPEYIKVYNKSKIDPMAIKMELPAVDSKGKYSECVECEACMGHCPQSINITGIMKELKELSK